MERACDECGAAVSPFAEGAITCWLPSCAYAQCGDCVARTGPSYFECQRCGCRLCADHGLALMVENHPPTEDPAPWASMDCADCAAVRARVAEEAAPSRPCGGDDAKAARLLGLARAATARPAVRAAIDRAIAVLRGGDGGDACDDASAPRDSDASMSMAEYRLSLDLERVSF